MPREFIVPGASRLSAALEVSRTVVRRAERRVIALDHDRLVPGAWLMPYLNRLADLLWVLARLAEQAEGIAADAIARVRLTYVRRLIASTRLTRHLLGLLLLPARRRPVTSASLD